MPKRLTDLDFCKAAKKLKCSVAAIKAVAQVESGGRGGFDAQGRLLLRFEGHKFLGFTNGKYSRDYPHLSYPYSRQKGKPHGRSGFNEAFELDQTAAMLSTSFGIWQVMGFNHAQAGYSTVQEMVTDYARGEGNQLQSFVNLIIKWGLDDELRRAGNRDFETFARMYNGKDYKSNNYHGKMIAYHGRYSRENIDCDALLNQQVLEIPQIPQFDPSVQDQVSEPVLPQTKIDNEVPPTDTSNKPATEPAPTESMGLPSLDALGGYADKAGTLSDKFGKVSQSSLFTTIVSKVGGWGVLGLGLFEDKLPIIIIGAVIVIAVLLYFHFSKKRASERVIALSNTGSG